MKKMILTAAFAAATFNMPALAAFTISGNIPGIPKGTKIELKSQERGGKYDLAQTVTASDDGKFTLTGDVESPTLAELRIEPNSKDDMGKALSLMVENAQITITAAHVDSLPPSFYVGTEGLLKEKNVTVSGGDAQKQYAEYKQAIFPYEFAAKNAHYNLYWANERKGRNKDEENALQADYNNAGVKMDSARRAFITQHPSYSISGLMALQDLNSPFSYTNAELDAIRDRMQQLTDTKRLAQVNRAIDTNRKYLRESPYVDFAVVDTLNAERRISDFAKDGKYIMIDFWASWCGPCRAAIPHVRELHDAYGDKLEILSVSVDSEEQPWRKAMAEEKMPWTQLWANQDKTQPLVEHYGLSGIPFLLVISPDGRILHAGHDPAGVNDTLARHIK